MNWIIGDIHGLIRPLEALLALVEKHDPKAWFIFSGDYVNRGPDSKAVIDLMRQLARATCLRGNHDEVFDRVLGGSGFAEHQHSSEPHRAAEWFLAHGLAATLMSYGIDYFAIEDFLVRPSPETLKPLVAAVPESHRKFLRELAPVAETPAFFVAHAKWPVARPDGPSIAGQLPTEASLRQGLLWGRFQRSEVDAPKAWKRTGYFGHTPTHELSKDAADPASYRPVQGPSIVLLDTGAVLARHGRLTAMSPESGTWLQVDRAGKQV